MAAVAGSFDIHMQFKTKTKEAYMVLLMAEMPKTIAFDGQRQITHI